MAIRHVVQFNTARVVYGKQLSGPCCRIGTRDRRKAIPSTNVGMPMCGHFLDRTQFQAVVGQSVLQTLNGVDNVESGVVAAPYSRIHRHAAAPHGGNSRHG